MSERIKGNSLGWHKARVNKKQLCVGIDKMWEAIEMEIKKEAKKGSVLPPDWRNRIFKEA